MSALLAIFTADNDTADLLFVVAWLVLWIVGIIMVVQAPRSPLGGIAWIGVGFIPLAYLFLTP